MAKLSKKKKTILEKLDRNKQYSAEEALNLLKDMPRAKFTESVDVAINLGVDPRKSDQVVRGSTAPSTSGGTVPTLGFGIRPRGPSI